MPLLPTLSLLLSALFSYFVPPQACTLTTRRLPQRRFPQRPSIFPQARLIKHPPSATNAPRNCQNHPARSKPASIFTPRRTHPSVPGHVIAHDTVTQF
ncbi:hypothetical protein FB45DRAFT_900185 [Roridomyces roridus]|uniref:Secreted protein n=1 Tax=Roridomyces roridus TaxID=1738132 RepID=A0AAD7C7S9_9AGAR|nr:hypothetical protein FB45DRAFT_900185 [Roridomyces roridus]